MQRPQVRPLRSLLFVPGSDEARLAEVPSLSADAVVLDMEEPQTPMTERVRERTRSLVSEFLGASEGHPADRPRYFARLRSASSVTASPSRILASKRPAPSQERSFHGP